jgi:hypothetical protein
MMNWTGEPESARGDHQIAAGLFCIPLRSILFLTELRSASGAHRVIREIRPAGSRLEKRIGSDLPAPSESHSGSLPRGDQHWRPASYFHETLTFLQIITEEAARFQPAIRPEKSANRRLTESFHNRCRRLKLNHLAGALTLD